MPTNLASQVARFKEWAPPHEGTYGEWECDYEHWDELWAAAEEAMKCFAHEQPDIETSNDLLYAIARDNEIERLRGELVTLPELLRHLARFGVNSPEWAAKWQLVVSIADAQLPDAAELIRPYLADNNEYVRRRSLLAIAPFSPVEAEEIAKAWMDENYEYSRIAGLHVLDIVNSNFLPFYLERHATDLSPYVRSNVDGIRTRRGVG